MAGDNYALIKKYIEIYKEVPTNPTLCKRKLAHIGNDDAQYKIELLDGFEVGVPYLASKIRDHIAEVYIKYGINTIDKTNKVPKPTDLCAFGVEMRKKKTNVGKIHYVITKVPDLD